MAYEFAEAIIKVKNHVKEAESLERDKKHDEAVEQLNLAIYFLHQARSNFDGWREE